MDRLDIIVENLNRIEKIAIGASSPWFTIKEASQYIKSSERTIRRWIATGILKSYKIPGGGRRILRRDLDSITMYGKLFNKLISDQKRTINELAKDQ